MKITYQEPNARKKANFETIPMFCEFSFDGILYIKLASNRAVDLNTQSERTFYPDDKIHLAEATITWVYS